MQDPHSELQAFGTGHRARKRKGSGITTKSMGIDLDTQRAWALICSTAKLMLQLRLEMGSMCQTDIHTSAAGIRTQYTTLAPYRGLNNASCKWSQFPVMSSRPESQAEAEQEGVHLKEEFHTDFCCAEDHSWHKPGPQLVCACNLKSCFLLFLKTNWTCEITHRLHPSF